MPSKSEPFINSSEVEVNKHPGDTPTEPGHYFVPDRCYFTDQSPGSIDPADSETSSASTFNDPGVQQVVSEFSHPIEFT